MERELRAKLPNGQFQGLSAQRSRIMRAVKGRNNRTTEVKFRLALVRSRIRGWSIRPTAVPGNPDFWFHREQVAVFVDGCFWHGCPRCFRLPRSNARFWSAKITRNRNKDRSMTRKLKASGVRVVRLWEHALKKNLCACVDRVLAALG